MPSKTETSVQKPKLPEAQPPSIVEPGKWLAYHITKDWHYLAKAPLAFLAVLGLSLIASWWLTWQVVVPEKNEQLNSKQGIIDQKQSAIESLKSQIEDANNEMNRLKSDDAAWKTEQAAFHELQQELKMALDTKSPKLSGSLDLINKMRYPNGAIAIAIEFSVRNLGYASIAENYYLTINSPELHKLFKPVSFDPPVSLPATQTARAVTFTKQDSLFEKTITPIVAGDLKRGWLLYQSTDITWDQISNSNVQFIVSFDDVTGTRHYVTNNDSAMTGSGGAGFPGSDIHF